MSTKMQPARAIHFKSTLRKVVSAMALFVMLWLEPLGLMPAHGEVFDQYKVKAVFLFNLTNFIDWPVRVDSQSSTIFTIGILGSDPFSNSLENVIKGEKAKGRTIAIHHFSNLDELQQQTCELLFINGEMLKIWPQIRSIARSRGILTVSDVNGFCGRGGLVNLLVSARKISIEINMNEARRHGFDISAKLLRVAHIVTGGKETQ